MKVAAIGAASPGPPPIHGTAATGQRAAPGGPRTKQYASPPPLEPNGSRLRGWPNARASLVKSAERVREK